MSEIKEGIVIDRRSLPPPVYESEVLEAQGMSALKDQAVCAVCPNAFWHVTTSGVLRVYCKSMSAMMDTLVADCEAYRQTIAELLDSQKGA